MMTIQQQGGRRRQIELEGSGMPFAAGIRWGGEMRMESTWLPGSPDGIAQIFGSKPHDFQVNGRWGDRDMVGGLEARCVVRVDGRQLTDAVEAAQVLDTVRKEGTEVRVAYRGIVRFGILREFTWGPFAEGRTLERIDWEARFEWLSEGEAPTFPSIPPRVGAQDLAGRLAIISQEIARVEARMQGVADVLLDAARAPVAKLRSAAASAAQTAQAWVQRAAAAGDVAQQVTGLAAQLVGAGAEIASAARSTALSQAAAIQQAGGRTASIGSVQTDADLGDQLVVAREALTLCQLAREAQDVADKVGAQTQAAVADAEPQITYVRGGEDLRDVALRTLGSYDGWRDLASLNGLAGSEVAPGTELLVPAGQRKLRTLT